MAIYEFCGVKGRWIRYNFIIPNKALENNENLKLFLLCDYNYNSANKLITVPTGVDIYFYNNRLQKQPFNPFDYIIRRMPINVSCKKYSADTKTFELPHVVQQIFNYNSKKEHIINDETYYDQKEYFFTHIDNALGEHPDYIGVLFFEFISEKVNCTSLNIIIEDIYYILKLRECEFIPISINRFTEMHLF